MVPATVLEERRKEALAGRQPATQPEAPKVAPEGAKLLARAFYRELREGGYTPKHILAASNELIDLVTQDLRSEAERRAEEKEAGETAGA